MSIRFQKYLILNEQELHLVQPDHQAANVQPSTDLYLANQTYSSSDPAFFVEPYAEVH
ncbi:MAG: hypothetical protein P8J37_04440 [Fuerstiella sp.]|nr:hypothetical protein [Fuerstiella sp.]